MNGLAIHSSRKIDGRFCGEESPWHTLASWVVLLLLATVGGCSTRTASWTEEVKLSNGRTVQVERQERYEIVGSIGGARGALNLEARLRVLDQAPASPEWVDRLEPLLLDVDTANSELVLICTSGDDQVWSARGKPTPPYWQFRLHDGKWIQEPVQEFVFGRETNLVIDRAWLREHTGPVTLAQKNKWRDENNLIKRYVSINRDSRFGID